jgi:hypothetical protein
MAAQTTERPAEKRTAAGWRDVGQYTPVDRTVAKEFAAERNCHPADFSAGKDAAASVV